MISFDHVDGFNPFFGRLGALYGVKPLGWIGSSPRQPPWEAGIVGAGNPGGNPIRFNGPRGVVEDREC